MIHCSKKSLYIWFDLLCELFWFKTVLGNIPNNDKKELLQATLNVIKENFPIEAIIDINEVDAFNRIDPCPLIIKPKWDTPMLIDPTPDSRYIVDFWNLLCYISTDSNKYIQIFV